MTANLKLLCILAHPDDESLGVGGTLARYAAEGVETCLLTATRGQRGWFESQGPYPGEQALGEIREGELRAAARVLGVRDLALLDYVDGDLDQADPQVIIPQIAAHLRRVRPQVVITFGPDGVYGHPDHIAISQFTTAAIVAAAGAGDSAAPAHRVDKLYAIAVTGPVVAQYEQVFGELVMHIDGAERRSTGWTDWAITTRLDTRRYWKQVLDAVACHCTQLPGYEALIQLPEEQQAALWGRQTFYRVFSLVNGGRQPETDLFAGLR